jgi:uncharacterized repeat protein (TIGR01451 family)
MKFKYILSPLLFLFISFSLFAQVQIGQDIDGTISSEHLGRSVSMPDANTIGIGAPGHRVGTLSNAGQALVYIWDGIQWIQKGQSIEGTVSSAELGHSVNMPDANTIAVGMPDYYTGDGRVQIFEWSGGQWIQKGQNIDGPISTFDAENLGNAIDMPNANTIAIASWLYGYAGTNDKGRVRIFEWNGAQWIQKGLNIDGEAVDNFSGCSISMPHPNTIAIGAYGNNGNGTAAGHARIYNWNGLQWVQKGIDIDSESWGDFAGYSVSMGDTNTIAIGAIRNDGNSGSTNDNRGHVRIYNWDGIQWVQKGQDIDGEAPNDESGNSISMPNANTLAIGAISNSENGFLSGHVRVYRWNGTQWIQKGIDIDGEGIEDRSGTSISMPDDNTVAIGAPFNDGILPGTGHVRIYKLSGIYGQVYQDLNQDCNKDPNELGTVENFHFTINPGNIIVQTDASGRWYLDSLPPNTYTITADTNQSSWQLSCPVSQTFTIFNSDSLYQTPSYGLFSTSPCPQPTVNIHAPFLRPGFSNQKVYVQACNNILGTATIDSTYTIVELDSLLTITGSSLPYVSLGNNQYQVYLTNSLFPGQCIDFWLDCTLSTNAILGQSLCMQADLFPVQSCVLDTVPNTTGLSCNSIYDNSHIDLLASCLNDTITFTVYNTGTGDMTCFSQVRLYIDGQLILIDSVQLLAGTTQIFSYIGDGRTWRLEVDQHPLHPGNSQPSITIELCGNPANWTPDLVNILPQDDADPIRDIYCGIVTGSYDPNDKMGYPYGLDSAHFIQANQDIEYRIRFQNTGTDTAFTVIIRDTLPQELNIFSVESGVSSHPYSFRMYGPRILEWTFNNILLPDSTTNEPASNGFVKFKVSQNPNLAIGTTIENRAGIYFDFNPPIITNTYLHTIDSLLYGNWVGVDTVNATVCDSFEFNGFSFQNTGQYFIPTSDSLYILNLNNQQSTANLTLASCDSLEINAQTYFQSGVYTQTFTNQYGCDSILTIDLTINNFTDSIITETACDSFTLNGISYFNTGIYQQSITNLAGCDSILTIDLTINSTTNSIIANTACDSFSINGETYFNSGTYQQIFSNAAGCDSTLNINLTIEESSNIDASLSWDGLDLQVAQTGASYQWLDCNNGLAPIAGATTQSYSPTANGSYAVEISSGNCTTISNCYDLTNVSINNSQAISDIRLYPNPTKNQITIDFGAWQEEVNIRLMGLDGRLIKELNSQASNQAQMELGELPQGLYLLEVQVVGLAPQTFKISKL